MIIVFYMILKIKPRQHILTFCLVSSPSYFGSELQSSEIALTMRCVFTFTLSQQCGRMLGICVLIGKKGSAMKTIVDCGGKRPWFYQLAVPTVHGF